MANFCLNLSISPAEYYNLTLYEREELIKRHNKLNKK